MAEEDTWESRKNLKNAMELVKEFKREYCREEEVSVINRPPEPKIVRLEGWEERELFSDGLDEGF